MMVLYGNALSTYCAKVRVVMRHKGIPYEDHEPPDGYGSPAYRNIVAMGTIPGFVDGELVLSESEAIAEYLEERFPDPCMLPGDAAQRAQVRAASRLHDCWVEPRLRAMYAQAAPARRNPLEVEAGAAEFHRRLEGFAAHLGDTHYIVGNDLTLADCAWATSLVQAELLFEALKVPLNIPVELANWRARLAEHPAVAPGIGPCHDAMLAWLAKVGAQDRGPGSGSVSATRPRAGHPLQTP
jgi:glutathione S-transferase